MKAWHFLKGVKYCPKSGLLFDNMRHSNRKPKLVLTKNRKGYIHYQKLGQHINVARLIMQLMGVVVPSNCCVDHINGKRSDNRFSNLRVVTVRQNNTNKLIHRLGKPVGFSALPSGRHRAQIKLGGKYTHLGIFDTEVEANLAYIMFLEALGLTKEDLK